MLSFTHQQHHFKVLLVPYDIKVESNMSAHVLLNLLKLVVKTIKCLTKSHILSLTLK